MSCKHSHAVVARLAARDSTVGATRAYARSRSALPTAALHHDHMTTGHDASRARVEPLGFVPLPSPPPASAPPAHVRLLYTHLPQNIDLLNCLNWDFSSHGLSRTYSGIVALRTVGPAPSTTGLAAYSSSSIYGEVEGCYLCEKLRKILRTAAHDTKR